MSAGENFSLKKKYLFWVFAILLICLFFYKVHSVLLPFYLSIFAVVIFNGTVKFLNKKLHIPRAVSSGVITLMFFSFIIYLGYTILNISFSKASTSVNNIKNNQDLINGISVYLENWLQKFEIKNSFNFIVGQFSDVIIKFSKNTLTYIVNYSSDIVSLIFLFALFPIVMFMMLKDMPTIGKNFYNLLPKSIQKEAKILLNDIYESVFKYLEGQTLAAVVLSICYSTILFFVGSNHFLLLGVVIGFSSFIPYIGFYASTSITLFFIYSQFHDLNRMIITLGLILIMQVIDSGFITPKIVGSKLGVHPLFVILGVLVSIPLFGFFGVLLALPIIGVVSVIAKFFFKKYKNSSYYK